MCTPLFCSLEYILYMFPSKSMVKGYPMFDFKKICVTFAILKLQKGDAYQNGVEFRHTPTRDVIKRPPPLVFLPQPLWTKSLVIYHDSHPVPEPCAIEGNRYVRCLSRWLCTCDTRTL